MSNELASNQDQEVTHQRVTNIAELLTALLSNQDVHTSDSGNFWGQVADLQTNEEATPPFYDALQKTKPDGYIIGVGIGALLSLIKGFPANKPPLGLIIADTSPRAVIRGRMLVSFLQECNNWSDFSKRFYFMSKDDFQRRVAKVLESDPQLAGAVSIGELGPPRWPGTKKLTEDAIVLPSIVKNRYKAFKQLAEENNIAICLADIANPNFIQAVLTLPNIQATNVVYLSNVLSMKPKEHFNQLQQLDSTIKPPVYVYSHNNPLLYLKSARSFGAIPEGQEFTHK